MSLQRLVRLGLRLALGIAERLEEGLLTRLDCLREERFGIITSKNLECLVDSRKLLGACPDALCPLISLRLARRLGLIKEGSVRLHLLRSVIKVLRSIGKVFLGLSFLSLLLLLRRDKGGHLVLLDPDEALVVFLLHRFCLCAFLQIHREGVVHILENSLDCRRCWVVGGGLLRLLVIELS